MILGYLIAFEDLVRIVGFFRYQHVDTRDHSGAREKIFRLYAGLSQNPAQGTRRKFMMHRHDTDIRALSQDGMRTSRSLV